MANNYLEESLNPLECQRFTDKLLNEFCGDELINKLKEDIDDRDNLFSMWELAQIYRNADCENEYIYYLKEIYNKSDLYMRTLRDEKLYPYAKLDLDVLQDSYIWSSAFLYAGDELASYYLALGTEKDYNVAIQIYRNLDCNYYDSKSKIKQAEISRTPCWTSNKIYFEDVAWEKACSETKIYLKTAEYLYNEFMKLKTSEQKTLDYSCVIILLMKALELELKKVFSFDYLNYLVDQNISPQKYAAINGISNNSLKYQWPIACKKNTYFIKKSDYKLTENIEPIKIARFTLGNLNYIVGRHDEKDGKHFYKTILDFCKESLNIENAKEWLVYITTSVDFIRTKRNKAAHAGEVVNITDAEFCFNQMIFINKLIENIIMKRC